MTDFHPIEDERFAETEFVVRADFDHSHDIWHKWCWMFGVPCEHDGRGFMRTIGEVAGRPIAAEVFWRHIGQPGKTSRVAFVDSSSQLVDHAMLDRWIAHAFPNSSSTVSAANFGNVLSDIRRKHGVLPMRDISAVERAARGVPLEDFYQQSERRIDLREYPTHVQPFAVRRDHDGRVVIRDVRDDGCLKITREDFDALMVALDAAQELP